MNKSLLLPLLALSLLFSSLDAVPTSTGRSQGNSGLEDLRRQQEVGQVLEVEGRMDLEYTDYPGTGANNRHDPRTPGRM